MAKKPENGKLREPEARLLALAIAASMPGHRASTTQIKDQVPYRRELTPADRAPSPTRNGEETWQQIVGNVVSHKNSATSIFSRGLAIRTKDGIEVTSKGLDYLRDKGLYP